MAELTPIEDFFLQAIDLLPVQFRDKDNIESLLEVHTDQIQKLEDSFWELYNETQLHEASGVNLDSYGYLFNVKRPAGMPDNQYFALIAGEIIARASDGTVDSIRSVMESVQRIYSSNVVEINNTINWRNNNIPYLTGVVMVYGYYNLSNRTLTGFEGDLLLQACPVGTEVAIYGEHIQLSDTGNSLFIPCEIVQSPDDLVVYDVPEDSLDTLVTDSVGTDNIAVSGNNFESYGKNWELAILPEDASDGSLLAINSGEGFEDFNVSTEEGTEGFYVQTEGIENDHGIFLEISTSTY